MQCHRAHGQLVVPVFYDVDPSVVRHQKGAFGKALKSTAKDRYLERSWRSALTQAANLSGWDVNNCR